MKSIKRYFSYIGKYKAAYWSVLIFTLITSSILNITYSYMNKLIFNAVEYNNLILFRKAAAICIILLICNCLAPFRRYFQIRIVRDIVFDIKIRLFKKFMLMDMTFYDKNHSGEIIKVLNSDANSLKDSYFSHIYWVLGRIVGGVTAIFVMINYNASLMLISVLFCALTVVISLKINKVIQKMDKEIQNKMSRLTAKLSDILSGFAELKMFSGAGIVYDNYFKDNQNVSAAEENKANKAAVLQVILFLLSILASFGTIGVGAYLVSKGHIDYGTVMAIVSLQMTVSMMLQSFGSAFTRLSSSLAKADRVFDFLEMNGEEAQENNCEIEIDENAVPIEIRNIAFSYDEAADIINNYSLTVSKGETTVLRGESGCGKSTLLKLLLRFYKEKQGEIILYGKNINVYSRTQIRDLITYVPQRNYLFEGTVRENIIAGVSGKEITQADIIKAAKKACADEFISLLPNGYDTYVKAGGNNMSVGQKQRIAIARAFLKDSPIILLDEPSSALDLVSENKVNIALEELMKEKAVIMVSHRK